MPEYSDFGLRDSNTNPLIFEISINANLANCATVLSVLLVYVHKDVHLQVAVVVMAVWGIFNNTNGLYLKVNT